MTEKSGDAAKRKLIVFLGVSALVGTALLAFASAAPPIIITQVIPNPFEESGSEAVEIYNAGDFEVDISGLVLATESQERDAVVPNNTFLPARTHFLIADKGFSEMKDIKGWPDADYEETITLYNSDSGVAIMLDDEVIDAVGWGNPSKIIPGLAEGSPAPNPPEGSSLRRRKENNAYIDTSNNSNDFELDSNPSLMSSGTMQSHNQSVVRVRAKITGENYEVLGVKLEPDDYPGVAGAQVLPNPGGSRRIVASIEVVILGNSTDLGFRASLVAPDNSTKAGKPMTSTSTGKGDARFSAELFLSYLDQPGEYRVEISSSNKTVAVLNLSYLAVSALEIDTPSVEFELVRGEESEFLGDEVFASGSAPTVRNIGNTAIDLGISSKGLFSSLGKIPPEALSFSFYRDVFVGSMAGDLSETPRVVGVGLAPGGTLPLSFLLRAGRDTPGGDYAGEVLVYAVPAAG